MNRTTLAIGDENLGALRSRPSARRITSRSAACCSRNRSSASGSAESRVPEGRMPFGAFSFTLNRGETP